MLTFLLACSDYELADEPELDSTADLATPGMASVTLVPEACNGADDDGDGLVDEGWPDVDGDGVVDCDDAACAVEPPPPGDAPVSPTCERVIDAASSLATSLVAEIEWAELATDPQLGWQEAVLAAPLRDTSGDGGIDIHDGPLIVSRGNDGRLSALDPASGDPFWITRSDDDGHFGAALCDLDGSGIADVVLVSVTIPPEDGCTGSCNTWHVERRDAATGRVVWTSAVDWSLEHAWLNLMAPECADLDGDGTSEIVTLGGAFSSTDGSRLSTFEEPDDPTIYWNVATADVDLDGDYEVATHGLLRSADGSVAWDSGLRARAHWTLVVQGDDDDEAEILMVTSDGLFLHDTGGELLASNPADFGGYDLEWPARPCAADFDGDGRQDYAVAKGGVMRAWDRDLVELWSAASDSIYDGAACVAWDMDGDGAHELLVNGGTSFTIYAGRDGTILFKDPGRYEMASVTSPVPIDIDRDGSAEIVVASSNAHGDPVLKIWGHPDNLLPAGPPSWPVEQFHGTNIGPMGEVPSTPPAYWLDNGGLFRGYPAGEHPAADLSVEITDSCQSSTWPGVGTIALSGLVANAGGLDAQEVLIEALAIDGSVLDAADLGTVATATSVPFELGFALDVACGGDVTLRVTTPSEQCDTANDTATLSEPDCSGAP